MCVMMGWCFCLFFSRLTCSNSSPPPLSLSLFFFFFFFFGLCAVQLIGFYTVFYGFLIAFFAICYSVMFYTLPDRSDAPKLDNLIDPGEHAYIQTIKQTAALLHCCIAAATVSYDFNTLTHLPHNVHTHLRLSLQGWCSSQMWCPCVMLVRQTLCAQLSQRQTI